jgi:hypothetical protein
MYDDVLVRLEDIVVLHDVWQPNQAFQDFGLSPDNVDLLLAQRLFVDYLECRRAFVKIYICIAVVLVLDYHHNSVAARPQKASELEQVRKLNRRIFLEIAFVCIANMPEMVSQLKLASCHFDVFTMLSQDLSRALAEVILVLVDFLDLLEHLDLSRPDAKCRSDGSTLIGVHMTVTDVSE